MIVNEVQLAKNASLITRVNERVKAEFAKVAQEKGVSVSKLLEMIVLEKLSNEGVSITITAKIV
jgi:antitoxin component of RelBE/YafQ-DinJ toxin-antitoxin module